ncbi:MAG: hypothetical protein Q8O41_06055, partial [Candidatus Methanoperedens sp.]|nr:hypothetical protein [Candidatus Methanoperedens sp.]
PGNLMMRKLVYLASILLLCISITSAAPENEYKITYTINVRDDGTAIWNVEYRTLLSTKDDLNSFENYTRQLQSVYLNEFKELMQKSASEAAVATSRSMATGDFTGDAVVQSSPTGKYGVVRYSFRWTNFAKADPALNIGDAFIGGLYLSKDNTLIIQYPSGYTVEQVAPQPDQIREGMIWYGLRSFGAGEPRIVLTKTSFPWIPLVIIIFIIAVGAFIYTRKIRGKNSKEITENISETDMMNLEDRILKLLRESGGSIYQSEIGRKLDLPKSTVSSALNGLHNKNLIDKIKKGRENLIRLK